MIIDTFLEKLLKLVNLDNKSNVYEVWASNTDFGLSFPIKDISIRKVGKVYRIKLEG